MMSECNKSENKAGCTCTYMACSKRGLCCECVKHHRDKGEIPGCFFPPAAERSYDRSIAAFIKAYSR